MVKVWLENARERRLLSMNNRDIELWATSSVQRSLSLTHVLDAYIAEDDKEPSWDGNVYVYSNEEKTKSALIGRVPVQVKGKKTKEFDLNCIKYQVSVADLKNYMNDCGVIYFVVLVSDDGTQDKIYYNALLPVKLKNVLRHKKNQKTKLLEFKRFPEDNRDKVNIFLDFHMNSQKQISFMGYELPSFEDLQKQQGDVEIVYGMNRYGYLGHESDLSSSFCGREIYMYANKQGFLQPLSDIATLCAVVAKSQQGVKVNENQYYSSYEKVYNQDEFVIKIGESLELVFNQQKQSFNLNIKVAPMLSDRMKDLKFLIDAFEYENLMVNDVFLDISSANLNRNDLKLELMKENYQFCCKIKQLLEILNIEDDLNLSDMTKSECQDLACLIKALVDGQTIRLKKTNDSKYIYFKIQNLVILILAREEPEIPYEYRFATIFSENFSASSKEFVNGKQLFYPTYSMLKAEHYVEISNINYGFMLARYKSFEKDNPNIYSQANSDVLEMLLAYDICKRKILLDTAIEIMQWILEYEEQDIIYRINYLQALARLRELDENEKEILIDIALREHQTDKMKFAANTLLKQQLYAKLYFDKLNDDSKAEIRRYPIYNLYSVLI